MAILVIFLAAALFVSGAAAANNITVALSAEEASVGQGLGVGEYVLEYPTGTNLSAGVKFEIDGFPLATFTTGSAGNITVTADNYTGVYASTTPVKISSTESAYVYIYVKTVKPQPTLPITAEIKNGTTVYYGEKLSTFGNDIKLNLTLYQNPAAVANVTVNFGDGTEGDTSKYFSSIGSTLEYTHKYIKGGTFVITYTYNGKTYTVNPSVSIFEAREVTAANNDTAFVYETIKVTELNAGDNLYFYSSDATPTLIDTITIGTNGYVELLKPIVNGHYGAWHIKANPESPYITIWYPEISLQAELTTNTATGGTSGDSIDGKTINRETMVSFLINAPKVAPAYKGNAYAKLVFTTPAAGKTTEFGINFDQVRLKNAQTIALERGVKSGENAPAGTWTVQAEYTLPKVFSDYAEKSNTISFTLQSTTLTITAAKDSVVRSNPFTVTISGNSKTQYAVYLEGANKDDINPTLQGGQSGFKYSFTKAETENQISVDALAGAVFETDASGKRTIQYNTAADTEDKTYTIKVSGIKESSSADKVIVDSSDYDKVKVKVEKGGVTITASGDGAYYIGDEIKLTGTNTDSTLVYLFITGQNLDTDGLILKALPTQIPAREATTSNSVSVKTDNTWEYKWDTAGIALDTGAYTIYATSRLTNGKSSSEVKNSAGVVAVKLSDSEYATISVNLKQPFLSAVPSGTIVAKGDKIYIRGTAEGEPATLQLYIFGPNFFEDHSITVEDDGSYEKKLEISSSMSSNQYFVVVQHPMYNGAFDAKLNKANPNNKFFYIDNETTGGSQQGSFVVWGPNKLQGSQAADALTKMIDDANIDDIYTKLTFTVAEPWIKINNPGDQATGSKFTITGTTNLAVDDQILVEVMSSSFSAVDKTATSTTSGVSQTTKVVKGETDNTWSVEVDTTNWKLDEYTIKVNGIEVDVSTTTNFNLVEKLPDTPKPTETGATAVPTTATATATATPATPGFGAFIALAGLGAVALLVLRRN